MSLPSRLSVFDKDGKEIAFGFTNCGWVLTARSLLKAILDSMEGIRIYNDGVYYSRQDNWMYNISYITAYGVKVPKDKLAFIMMSSSDDAEALIEVLMNETTTN